MEPKIRPLKDRVVVRRSSAEEKTKGGLIIPDNAKEKPIQGEVLAIGPDVKDIEPGNVVLFGKYAGNEIHNAEDEVLLIKAEDILGVIERTE